MLDLLRQGGEIALLGMVVVFAVLVLLVFVVQGMSRLAMRLAPALPEPPATLPGPAPLRDAEIAAVVTAAVRAYRDRGSSS